MKSEKETHSVNQIVEMGKRLLLEGDMDTMLSRAMDSVIALCHAERGLILFFDDHDQIVFQTARNLAQQDLETPEFELSRTIIEQTKQTAQPVCLKNAYADSFLSMRKSVIRLKLLSVICVPLIHKEKVFGLIYMDNRSISGMFSLDQCSLLKEFADFILLAALRAFEIKKLNYNLSQLEMELRQRYRFNAIIGHHPQMLEILKVITQISHSDVSVLIQGETGTGKELIARALHFNSHRSKKPFIPVNCAAIPENLLESELFGHARGAFTGAFQDKEGLFLKADGGTVFLDEICELPLSLQPKLLRILQTGEYKRLGNDDLRFCNVRIVAATSKNLHDLVLAQRFRDDLYYRLNVIEFALPPLRQRRDDMLLLIDHFLEMYKTKQGKPSLRISSNTVTQLFNYDYPGNIRELENVIQRAVVLAEGDLIEPHHLPTPFHEKTTTKITDLLISPFRHGKKRVVENFEKDYIVQALIKTNGNVTRAAELAGMNVKNFHTKMKKYHLAHEQFRK